MLRTPLLPFDDWLGWTRLADGAPESEHSSPEEEAEARKAALRSRLAELLTPDLLEAFYTTSSSFAESVEAWLRDPEGRRGQAAEAKLVAYFSRMAGRPTPFGLFSGFTLGGVGGRTSLGLPARSAYARRTRLDYRYLLKLADAFEQDKSLRRFISYRPNSSLYPAGGKLRYFERANGPGKGFHYRAAVCEPSDYMEAVLERARHGATWEELVETLALYGASAEGGAGTAEELTQDAADFIDELIESQILVSELRPALAADDPAAEMIRRMRRIRPLRGAARSLSLAARELARIDARGLGNAKEDYAPVVGRLREVGGAVDFKESDAFFIDLLKPAPDFRLGAKVTDEIVRGLRVLHSISWHQEKTLDGFAEAFEERFGTREVPLLEALDEESGVRFRAQDAGGHQLSEWDRALLWRVASLESDGGHTLRLDEAALRALETSQPKQLIPCFSVFATVAAESEEAVEDGRYSLFVKSYSPSASLFGRFCSVDEDLRAKVEQMLRAEEATLPDAVHAEIVHYPAGPMLNNILTRPALRRFTIPLLAESATPADEQLQLSDLTVSVREGRVRLRSVSLDREVIPHNSNAHAYIWGYNLPVYQFLCSLSIQLGAGAPVWSWGPVLESLPYLPRVVFGRMIFAKARWRVAKGEIDGLKDAGDAELLAKVGDWRRGRGLPRFVALAEADQQLPVDLENILSVKSFLSLVRNKNVVVLSEMLPSPEELCVHSPEGRFQHELTVPFICPEVRPAAATPPRAALGGRVSSPLSRRVLLPGSDWMYAKIYASPSAAERLLTEAVLPLTRSLERRGARWFFIRYQDPHHHLRLRVRCGGREQFEAALREFGEVFNPLLDGGGLWRVQLDTYEREVERYGGPLGVELAEEIFHADSRAVLGMLGAAGEDEAKTNLRLCLGVAGANALLEDFGLGLRQRMEIARQMRNGFRAEMEADVVRMRVLGEKISADFRTDRERLTALLGEGHEEYTRHLKRRSDETRGCVRRLRESAGDLTQPLTELLKSYIHMHVNRLLRFPDRQQELVIYDYLYRTLDYFRARGVKEARGARAEGRVS